MIVMITAVCHLGMNSMEDEYQIWTYSWSANPYKARHRRLGMEPPYSGNWRLAIERIPLS